MTKREVERVMTKAMRRWDAYCANYKLFAVRMQNGNWSLGYSSPQRRDPRGTYWDANIIKGAFYLLHIQIAKSLRGKGHGSALYLILETIAKDLGCTSIVQHPSGSTITGESRRDYLLRRGWQSGGVEVYKALKEPAFS